MRDINVDDKTNWTILLNREEARQLMGSLRASVLRPIFAILFISQGETRPLTAIKNRKIALSAFGLIATFGVSLNIAAMNLPLFLPTPVQVANLPSHEEELVATLQSNRIPSPSTTIQPRPKASSSGLEPPQTASSVPLGGHDNVIAKPLRPRVTAVEMDEEATKRGAESSAKIAKRKRVKEQVQARKVESTTTTAAIAPAAEEKPSNSNHPEFRWPVRGRIIQGFADGGNDGINIAVPKGTPVKAADAGVVAYAGNELKGYGNLVVIRHPNGFVTVYAHNSETLVKRGDQVTRGHTVSG